MHDTTHWEADEEWLYERLSRLGRRPTESQIEAFCERVAIRVSDGTPAAEARTLTILEQFR